MLRWTMVALLLLSGAACDSGSDRAPSISPGLRVAVEVDGEPGRPIDAARLRDTEPDYRREGAQAWRLSSLLGSEYERSGTILQVHGGGGESRTFTDPSEGVDGNVLALMLNRRGELVVVAVPPDGPLPASHGGSGSRRGRGGKPDRVHHVKRLELHHATGAGGS